QGRARQDRDERRRASQTAPFAGERRLLGGALRAEGPPLSFAHGHAEYCGRALFPDQEVQERLDRDVGYRGGPLRLHIAAALALVAIAVVAPSAVAAPSLKTCSGQEEFACGTLDVPLDRTGAVPGVVHLHYAVQRRGPKPILFALSG